jgi:hypothetical protein
MDQWRDFPLPDGSYSDGTRPWSQQDICNYLPTYAEQSGTRSRIKYACAPGLATFATVGTGPHRGIHNCEGKLFVVSGESLYQVFVTGNSSLRGTIPGTAPVSMTHNQIDGGNELLIGTGDSSYVYNTKTGQLHQNDNVPLASVDFLNQLCLGVDVGRRFWRYSALADARTWNTLDNESAESSPDLIVGLKVSQGEVAVFGGRTIEIWANDPTQDTAFQRTEVIERGCASANSIQRLDNTLFWQAGDGIVYRLNGYQPVPISPKALTDEFLTCDLQGVRSYVHTDKGYVIYYLTFPDGRTWGYDVTAQKWHRRQSFGLDRWRLNTLVRWYDGWYGGDYSSGKIYRLTWGYVYEGCELMPRSIRTGVTHNSGNRVFLHGFRLNMETGGRETTVRGEDPPSISGTLPDGTTGDTVSYQYTITPAYPGQEVTLSVDGTFPPGLSIDATGLVTGTLTAAGTFSWSIIPSSHCADGDALADSATIEAGTFTLLGDVPDGYVGGEITGTYSQLSGTEPVTYVVLSGTFPPGLTLDPDGSYSGTLTTEGAYSWVIQGTDDNGSIATLNDSNNVIDLSAASVIAESTNSAAFGFFGGGSYPSVVIHEPARDVLGVGVDPQITQDAWVKFDLSASAGSQTDRVAYYTDAGALLWDSGWWGDVTQQAALNAKLGTLSRSDLAGTIHGALPHSEIVLVTNDIVEGGAYCNAYCYHTVNTADVESHYHVIRFDLLPVGTVPLVVGDAKGYYIAPDDSIYKTSWATP